MMRFFKNECLVDQDMFSLQSKIQVENGKEKNRSLQLSFVLPHANSEAKIKTK